MIAGRRKEVGQPPPETLTSFLISFRGTNTFDFGHHPFCSHFWYFFKFFVSSFVFHFILHSCCAFVFLSQVFLILAFVSNCHQKRGNGSSQSKRRHPSELHIFMCIRTLSAWLHCTAPQWVRYVCALVPPPKKAVDCRVHHCYLSFQLVLVKEPQGSEEPQE